jgi:hypothetical protein
MTASPTKDPLPHLVDPEFERPLPAALATGRRDLLAAVRELRTLTDADLTRSWPWKGGSEEEVRYAFYRIAESFELAGIEAQARNREAGVDRGRAADRIAPATAARWDLQGLLRSLPDSAWDADPGDQEWTIRQTMAHVIQSQRYYGVGTAWWQRKGYAADDPELPAAVPDPVYADLPSEEAEGEGTPSEVRDRLDDVVDRSSAELGGLPVDRLVAGARWSGFAVDVDFRLGRWSSHLREHTVQIEKTLVMIDSRPTEVDRLVRLVVAAWGRAEAEVYGASSAEAAAGELAAAAASARITATDVLRYAAGLTPT